MLVSSTDAILGAVSIRGSLTAAVVLLRCSGILIGIVEILVGLFCGENELDDCNREINRLTPKLSAHTFVNAFTAL